VEDPHVRNSALVELEDKVRGHHGITNSQTNGRKRLEHFSATDTHGATGLQEELGEGPVHGRDHDDLAKLAELALDKVQEHLVGA
jgi:hypothetical protein